MRQRVATHAIDGARPLTNCVTQRTLRIIAMRNLGHVYADHLTWRYWRLVEQDRNRFEWTNILKRPLLASRVYRPDDAAPATLVAYLEVRERSRINRVNNQKEESWIPPTPEFPEWLASLCLALRLPLDSPASE